MKLEERENSAQSDFTTTVVPLFIVWLPELTRDSSRRLSTLTSGIS